MRSFLSSGYRRVWCGAGRHRQRLLHQQLPPRRGEKVNPYDKIDFEAPYPPLANGGFICYGEYPNIQHNLKALEDVWDYSYQHVPYYGTNTPIDECYECGFTGEFECTSKGFTCPKCGNHDAARVSVTRRVCGYLGSPDARPFNAGKQEEVKRRVKHLGNGQIG